MKTFDEAFTSLMGSEKGYVDDPRDPGGATRWGVAERVAREHGYAGDMKELPYDLAKQIAKDVYWDKCQCDSFDIRIAYQLFDACYNGGHPVQWLQQALGITVDGVLGKDTIAAAAKANPQQVAAMMNSYRLVYMTNLPGWKTFGAGWSRRIAKCLLIGVSSD
jgi:lysozyme family protein